MAEAGSRCRANSWRRLAGSPCLSRQAARPRSGLLVTRRRARYGKTRANEVGESPVWRREFSRRRARLPE